MPELPEVETIRIGLEKKIRKKVIKRVDVFLPKQVRGMSVNKFKKILTNQQIMAVERRSKFLILKFKEYELYIHLGMTGQVTFCSDDQPKDKHTHIILYLEEKETIQYRDIRQFGYFRLLKSDERQTFLPLRNLGIEPLDESFTWEKFSDVLAGKKGMAKPMLLSQRPICGLGNIYADEALYRAGIHPKQKMDRLSKAKLQALFEAIPFVLRKGLENGGTTLRDYVGADGEKGKNVMSLQVYGRAGKLCFQCGMELKRILVAQRSTVFCRGCQKSR